MTDNKRVPVNENPPTDQTAEGKAIPIEDAPQPKQPSIEELEKVIADIPAMASYLKPQLDKLIAERDKVKREEEFKASVSELTKLPTPPTGISNVFITWAMLDGDKEFSWHVTVNHACRGKAGGSKKEGNRSHAITVYKRNGLALEPVGNFRAGSEACKFLNLEYEGNSAIRVLKDKGYHTETYEGDQFTVAIS